MSMYGGEQGEKRREGWPASYEVSGRESNDLSRRNVNKTFFGLPSIFIQYLMPVTPGPQRARRMYRYRYSN